MEQSASLEQQPRARAAACAINGLRAAFFTGSVAFAGRARMDRESVDAALDLGGQRVVDHAVAIETALAVERRRHDIDTEVGLSAWLGSGMAFVPTGFILDPHAFRGKS